LTPTVRETDYSGKRETRSHPWKILLKPVVITALTAGDEAHSDP
jgi:hypothetical protein